MRKEIILDQIRPPFNFELTAPSGFPWEYSNGACSRALRLTSGNVVVISVRSIGTVESPKLEVSVDSETKINSEDMDEISRKISWIFDLNRDVKGFYSLAKRDPILRSITQKFYGMRAHSEPTVFETIILCICEQQVNLRLARKMRKCLIKRFGKRLKLNDKIYYAFPSPEALAEAEVSELKKCKLSRYKVSYIKGISKAIAEGKFNPERLKTLPNKEAVEKLMKFKGIGRWTAEYVVARGLRRLALPADDSALRRSISNFYFDGEKISSEKLREFMQPWRKHIDMASFYLLRASRG